MKSILSLVVVSLLGTMFASATIPTEIPFGKQLILNSLAKAERGSITSTGEGVTSSQIDFAYQPVDSTKALGDIVRAQKVDFTISDPRKRILIVAKIQSGEFEDLFVGYNSFVMAARVDAFGRKTYVVPQDAGSVYFSLVDQSVPVADAKSAMILNQDGFAIDLVVENGKIVIPGFVASNSEFWSTLQVTYAGMTVQYDQNGKMISNQNGQIKPTYASFQSISNYGIWEGLLEARLSPEYGWNPIIECTNPVKQVVTLDIGLQNGWGRPTFVRICTLDQIRSGITSGAIEYDLEGDEYGVDQIDVNLDPGTYFIQVEWPSYIQYNSYGGGKGG